MARARKYDPTPLARRMIRDGLESGLDNAQILANVRESYPNVNVNQIRSLIPVERQRKLNVNNILNSAGLSDRDVGDILGGCGPDSVVRGRGTITYTRPDGTKGSFGHTVDVSAGTTVAEFMAAMAEAIRRYALEKGSPVPTADALMGDENFDLDISYLECL